MKPSTFSAMQGALLTAALLMQAACGGGKGDESEADPIARSELAPTTATIDAQLQGARLNAAELAQIAKTGVLPNSYEGQLLSGAKAESVQAGAKSAASRAPVYRFYLRQTGAHFFTMSETERDHIIASLPAYNYEGIAFYASPLSVPGLSPVYRFYNALTGVHFYTISDAERAHILATLPQFAFEGVAYYASTLPGTGYTPLYRFYFTPWGFHFYTNSETEKNTIIASLPQYRFEGVAYHVLGSDWLPPALPHSGVTTDQCYRQQSDVLVTCTPSSEPAGPWGTSLDLNPQQDGHRTHVLPMSFSLLPIFAGESAVYSASECVKDNVTGLVWEGKTASGNRAGTNQFSNLGNNASGDVSAYAAFANQSLLCGFGDWRLPTAEELQGIVNYGVTGGGPKVTVASFPNTQADEYWTSSERLGYADHAWTVDFSSGYMSFASRSTPKPVRLVRGAAWTGPRYLVYSSPYPGDAANNVAVDRKTGLVWRRCVEGMAWNGSACLGPALTFNQEAALMRASTRSGWRLPNAKELGSLADRSRSDPALEPTAFPGAVGGWLWSSTPLVTSSDSVWNLGLPSGDARTFPRSGGTGAARLVLTNP
jgi:hypothetical protein